MLMRHLPNLITILNLLSGCVGITLAFAGNIHIAAFMIGVAAIFDFLDGFTARMLHVNSDIGKQLDSLADIISFGLLPGVIVFQMMNNSLNIPQFRLLGQVIPPFLAFILPAFSALRLARFNIDPRQTNSFFGLPTPASALLFGSFPLIARYSDLNEQNFLINSLLNNYYFLAGITILISILLVSEIPLIALKFKNFKWSGNQPQYLLLLSTFILAIFLGLKAIPLSILIYIIISLAYRSRTKSDNYQK